MAVATIKESTAFMVKLAVIDCDIHNAPPSNQALAKYMPKRWADYLDGYGLTPVKRGAWYPKVYPKAARADSWPTGGGAPGSDLAFLQTQLLDEWGISYGLLNPLYGVKTHNNAPYAQAVSRALNDWQVAEWLDPEPRLRGSIATPYEAPDLAAEEIDRCAQDPRFAHILLLIRTSEPLGRRKYWPLYAAAVRNNLPVAIHFGGAGDGPITGNGWPSFYYEDHTGMAQAFQPQVASLVLEGVFEQFPDLRIILIEAGFAWMAPLMWRLDRSWRLLRNEVPDLRQPPSQYIRKHFWMTTQPVEEPAQPAHFQQLLQHIDMDDRFLFATDYPHWDFDSPSQALPPSLAPELRRKILAENAAALYGFYGG